MTGDRGVSPLAEPLVRFRSRYHVPAVIGAVVQRDGWVDARAIGVTRRNRDAEPVTTDDRWHIGSCGKSITAVLWARLVEAGVTEWRVPIRDLFSDLTDLDRGWANGTVEDLLRCRAGVPANPPRERMEELWESRLDVTEQRSAAAESVLRRAPADPGRFVYSNLGYVLVGAAVDRLAGVPFEQAVHEYVFAPLEIESSGVGPPPRVWGHRSRIAMGSLAVGRGAPAHPTDPRSDNPQLLTPAGRFHLTIGDWARFQRIFLDGGRPILRQDTIRHLLAVPADEPRSMAMGWAPARGVGASAGMQGSNMMWAATALISAEMDRTAMVIVNDGRTRVLRRSALLAAELLQRTAALGRP